VPQKEFRIDSFYKLEREGNSMSQVEKLLREIEQARFWGSLQVDFQNGQVTLIRKTETFKPQQQGTTHEANRYTSR
jgi:hypothetical protein